MGRSRRASKTSWRCDAVPLLAAARSASRRRGVTAELRYSACGRSAPCVAGRAHFAHRPAGAR
jgi:hypothetical protein